MKKWKQEGWRRLSAGEYRRGRYSISRVGLERRKGTLWRVFYGRKLLGVYSTSHEAMKAHPVGSGKMTAREQELFRLFGKTTLHL